MTRALVSILAAFVYFHSLDGGIVAVDTAGGQVIVKPVPPGYLAPAKTMIETGSGTLVVTESVCQVAHALERQCP